MKIIFNLFFYGCVFYLINFFFPEFFQMLVSWADQGVVWIQDLWAQVLDKLAQSRG